MKISNAILTVLFLVSGVLHLVNPEAFLWLPEPIFLIYLSGVFELVGAAACIFRQRWAGWFCALVLLGVYPANIWFAFDSLGSGDARLITAAFVRLPLQLPLIYFALKYSKLPSKR